MKIALLADLHANLEAVTACLDHAGREGYDRLAFLGDLVGYGADPVAVLELVMERARAGALVVRGNHDDAALEEEADEGMNPSAKRAAAWTRTQLGPHHREFLSNLPFLLREEGMLLVHGSALAPEKHEYVTDARGAAMSLGSSKGATWVLSGHVHEPALYFAAGGGRPVAFKPVPGVVIPVPSRRQWLAIVGSSGQPRDGNTAACYAVLDLARAVLTFHRVPYDWSAAARKIRDAGLPERLAVRLETGE